LISVTVNSATLAVKRADVSGGGRANVQGPMWNIQGSGALPRAQITIKTGGGVFPPIQADQRGNWSFSGRAIPGMTVTKTSPPIITISSPGASDLDVTVRVR
jgi:hypothetical protein